MTGRFAILDITQRLYLAGKKILLISEDDTPLRSTDHLITEKAIKDYVDASIGGGGLSGSTIITGWAYWSGTGLVYDVTPATYLITGTYHASLPGAAPTVTLATAHPTLPRIDVIYWDDTGNNGVITGVPGANPVKPQVDPATQVELSFVLVEAGATTPTGVTNTIVYDENTESTGASDIGSVNYAYGTGSFNGSVNTLVPSFTTNKYLSYLKATTIYAADYQFLNFKLKLGATWNTSTFLSVYLYNGASAISAPLNISSGTYGFTRTVVGTWQFISIPLSAFALSSNAFNKVYLRTNGSNASGFQLDLMLLQAGNNTVVGTGVNSFNTRTGHVMPAAGDYGPTIGGTGQTAYATGDLLYASATNVLSRLPAGTNGHVLTLGSGVPTWAAAGGSMVYPGAGIPVSTGSAWGSSITNNSANWNTAYGWGNHALAGYLTSLPAHNHSAADITSGILAQARGGTGFGTYSIGDLLYASASNVLSKLSVGTNGDVLTLAGGVPTWGAPGGGGGWSLSGNSLSGSEFLGTTNATSLVFKTNNADKLIITSAGEIQVKTGNSLTWGSSFAWNSAIFYDGGHFTERIGAGVSQDTGGLILFGRGGGILIGNNNDSYTMTAANCQMKIASSGIISNVPIQITVLGNMFSYGTAGIGSAFGFGVKAAASIGGVFVGNGNDFYIGIGHDGTDMDRSNASIWIGVTYKGVNIGNTTEVSNAILTMESTTKGVLFPRMTTTQWTAIGSKPEGLQGWDNVDHAQLWYDGTRTIGFRYNGTKFQGYDGTAWLDLN